ncbi:cyclophilin-like fold protein [Paraburkholderia graminis]|uniref:cyclophilin-like fold protein n=1 Tax=Paraburkholderia graminis TaxID=60548 RepID=UPI0038BD3D96
MATSRNLTIGFVFTSIFATACEAAPPAPLLTGAITSESIASIDAAPKPTSSSPEKIGKGAAKVIGIDVRFSAGSNSVDVRIDQDNPAVRDFLSMLPLRLKLQEFNQREKIGYLPRKLKTNGAPGSDPEDGDLIYYVPWGNIGFYYNAACISYSDKTIHLGTYKASRDQLKRLEDASVTVEVVR